MATYVLVPGGWSGGWQWRAVAKHLRTNGHEVFTPTLTGLGERVHLANPDITLGTHTQDVVNNIRFEDLTDVFLVGYSYSGMVITAVADCISERLAHLIYIDAYVPGDGQSLADILGPEVMVMLRGFAQQYGDGWRLPHYPPDAPSAPIIHSTLHSKQFASNIPKPLRYHALLCSVPKTKTQLTLLCCQLLRLELIRFRGHQMMRYARHQEESDAKTEAVCSGIQTRSCYARDRAGDGRDPGSA